MGYLDKLLEEMKKKMETTIETEKEKIANDTNAETNADKNANNKVEIEQDKNKDTISQESPQSTVVTEEKGSNWLSNKTEGVANSVSEALEKAKEQLTNGQNPSEPEEAPPQESEDSTTGNENENDTPNSDGKDESQSGETGESSSDTQQQNPNGNQNSGNNQESGNGGNSNESGNQPPIQNEQESVPSYPSVEGERIEQEGITEDERETEREIMAGQTPTDSNGQELKLPVILPEYELMVYDALTDEEIVALVRSQLEAYKNAGISSINATAESEKNNAQGTRGAIEQSKTENERATNTIYDSAKNKIDADMIKRGLARSSIASLLVSESENARARTLADHELQYRNALQEIDNKISEAESKRQRALESFNIEYAVKYAEEVKKLQEERAKKEEEVLKYNNTIKEKMYDDKLAGLKTQETLSKQSKSNSSSDNDEDDYYFNGLTNNAGLATGTSAEKLYNIYRDKLLAMSKEDAKYELRNDTLYSKTLPTDWYLELVNEFGR